LRENEGHARCALRTQGHRLVWSCLHRGGLVGVLAAARAAVIVGTYLCRGRQPPIILCEIIKCIPCYCRTQTLLHWPARLLRCTTCSGSSFSCSKKLSFWRRQSVLARGLHALLPPIEVVKQSYCNADPEQTREWEVRRRARDTLTAACLELHAPDVRTRDVQTPRSAPEGLCKADSAACAIRTPLLTA